ncbi:hypothetical protein O7598_31210 [Micromonospora sp. WMMC241]|uniref:hypothetical protein n=1 Tax=Micromonospora sp. WMMC241 TaxID=3015159 RepID=UPI0022B6EEA7|nr:hypothetical protein [Micromonospora sp. WMMC241]MCZ7434795.1 hypothetical protein [Micromonospora sp. WMMC241]MCZ7440850.1 hypothetical protein [Micromonospora sp. WMMC241]MCZ7440895.1 hypothetical protein [Micromonospora sp. WMMC241]
MTTTGWLIVTLLGVLCAVVTAALWQAEGDLDKVTAERDAARRHIAQLHAERHATRGHL